MGKPLTFGQKVGLGFGAILLFAIFITTIAVYSLRSVVQQSDHLITSPSRNLFDAAVLQGLSERTIAHHRGFLLTADPSQLAAALATNGEFEQLLGKIEKNVTTAEERNLLERIGEAGTRYSETLKPILERRKNLGGAGNLEEIVKQFQNEAVPGAAAVRGAINAFIDAEQRQVDQLRATLRSGANQSVNLVVALALGGIVLATILAFLLSRMLGRQIGTAVQHIRSSSAELQAAANQQSASSREQAAAMIEIATTIRELVATAREIAESAKRVSGIADETTRGAQSGDEAVQASQDLMGSIRHQVDQIVHHMLDLGRKSHQITGILEVINELADQTNILAINASIEAAGAGESNRRFAVVADEIRRLADRVGGSTKEIKGLIEEIRSAVHTTVMATESGSKTVDQGTRQFTDVSKVFRQIVRLIETTTEAAREIELSTKQQTTAVEQVNEAISNVAQAARESETSSSQTLQTATELSALSREISRLIQLDSGA